ncbi:amidohydrolase [Peptoniphilus sp. MSJ-1]|uniref:Amidohydrolase n=1 Tax=Peptoniphilus ovalis TaxID=2841503 RepID=A0ABS6FF39_9FIRM|nr:M20 family metallopeptidase [Peptoniphilus ovalis]MBU5668799.1 amidohydrolase [Peptoniphilus ovalis]
MKKILNDFKFLNDEIIKNRRTIHEFAELGFELDKTKAFVKERLVSYGIKPNDCGKAGITFTLGNPGGKTILLRADMDALPMEEESDLDFAARNGNCHACGHDIHTSMLLATAKYLKEHEEELKGYVKFMFQPAEEIMAGAEDMIENGILENPKVDAAFAIHVMSGRDDTKSGTVQYKSGPLMLSGDAIKVKVFGKPAHGSTPYLGVDAIQVASRIAIDINSMVSTNFFAKEENIALVGKISGGTAVNTVADYCEMEVSLRSESHESRKRLFERVEEISLHNANLFGAKAVVEHVYGMPPLINEKELSMKFTKYVKEILGDENAIESKGFTGSEDFSSLALKVPSVLFTLGVGSIDEGVENYLHHPNVQFKEDHFYVGAAVHAYIAKRFLEENN